MPSSPIHNAVHNPVHNNTVSASLVMDAKAARAVQRRFMPAQTESWGHYTLSHRAYSKMPLSGDFVDYAYLGEGKILFFIVDISGHGSGAGLITLMVKQAIQRKAKSLFNAYKDETQSECSIVNSGSVLTERWPSDLVSAVNEDLLEMGCPCHFTGVVGIIDGLSHQLHYVSAGHYPLPAWIQPQTLCFLGSKSKPVGLFKGMRWESRSISLKCGGHLAILTDGIWPFVKGGSTLDKESRLLKWLNDCLLKGAPLGGIRQLHIELISEFDRLIHHGSLEPFSIAGEGNEHKLTHEMEPEVFKASFSTSDDCLRYCTLPDDVSMLVISRGE